MVFRSLFREEGAFLLQPREQQRALLNFLPDARDILVSRPAASVRVSSVFASNGAAERGGFSAASEVSLEPCECLWGVSVPGDANHVVYVWLDALAGYLAPSLLQGIPAALLQ